MASNEPVHTHKAVFENAAGDKLAARLELPLQTPRAFALFAHCFTCSKDSAAASRISRALAALGLGVLRFDFTGLGGSEGDFANTNFSSNVADLLAAADYLRQNYQAPSLLIGHSLGGAAVLSAAAGVDEVKTVVTIGAPADPGHVAHLLADARAQIESTGTAMVTLGGREFRINKQFLDDISAQRVTETLGGLRKALLVMHSPIDDVVEVDNAAQIFLAARHPKSFVSLDDADHLLSRRADADYAAATLAAWAERYLPEVAHPTPGRLDAGEVLVEERDHRFAQFIYTDKHRLRADEPKRFGGTDTGPSPYELLLAALGTCTAMTIRMYASRKQLPLDAVRVKLRHEKIHAEDCDHCETATGKLDRIERHIELDGDLDADQHAALIAIANKCPVHRTLHGEIDLVTTG